jgi:hypothetical protein
MERKNIMSNISYNETIDRYVLKTQTVDILFNSLKNARLVEAIINKDERQYGDYIFSQKDFDGFLGEEKDGN